MQKAEAILQKRILELEKELKKLRSGIADKDHLLNPSIHEVFFGTWQYIPEKQTLLLSKMAIEMLKLPSRQSELTIDEVLQYMHPSDHKPVKDLFGLSERDKSFEWDEIIRMKINNTWQKILLNAKYDVTDKSLLGTITLISDKINPLQSYELNEFIKNLPFSISIYDNKGNYVYVNEIFTNYLGYTLDDLKDMEEWSKKAFPDTETRSKVLKMLERTMKDPGDNNPSRILEIRTKKGEKKVSEINLISLGAENTLLLLNDITEKTESKENYIETIRLFKTTFMSSPDMVTISRFDNGAYSDVNKTFEQTLGYKKEEVIGKTSNELELYQNPNERNVLIEKLQKQGHFFGHETKINAKNGKVKIVSLSASTIAIQKVPHIITIIRDITEKKNFENALRLTQFSINNTTDIIFWIKETGQIIFSNDAATKFLGYSNDEINVTPIFEIIQSLKKINWELQWTDFKEKESSLFESQFITKTGQHIPFEVVVNFFTFEGDEYLLAFCRDTTERKNNEEELLKAKEKAEASDKMKSAFLSTMSHEIRTPMNAILGFSNLLTVPDLDEETQKSYINQINQGSLNLLNIINDIIDFSKVEAGEIRLNKKDFNVNELIYEIYTNMEQKLAHMNKPDIQLNVFMPPDMESMFLKSDEQRIRQVLSNLISNSLKFTQKGYVNIGYQLMESEALHFFVQDTGIGIPKDKLQVIFDRFQKLEDKSQYYSGIGLGLAISERLIKLLGGKIWAESEQGKGATFHFTIPLEIGIDDKIDKKIAGKEFSDYNWTEKNILIAEDEESNFLFLKELVSKTGANVLRARTGEDAILQFFKNKNIHLILMDIKMPKMDGYTASKKIREVDKNIPIISQTAYAMIDEEQKSREAGCNDYISKPIDPHILLNKMEAFL